MRSRDRRDMTAARTWLVIGVGVPAAWAWVEMAQRLGSAIASTSAVTAAALFYLILFAPLAAVGLGAAVVSGVPALRIGEAPRRWAMTGLAGGTAGLLATLALSWMQGGVAAGAAVPAGAGVLALGLVLTLFQTAAEELFFRGWLQPALVARIGPAVGIAAATLCFAAFHVVGGARAPVSLANIVLAGLFFGLLAWRSGGIVAGIAAHFGWNAIESCALGLVPNPGVDVFGALIDLDLRGAALWGGQEEGLNASIGTTAVLLALVVPLAWQPRRHARPRPHGAAARSPAAPIDFRP